mmetsp:Transcript_8984/g.18112  ORF Transcript_8984/g.18112 Transcript_8984/m.18112 type:complete len:197 (+) Transcript_8984:257-847(+)
MPASGGAAAADFQSALREQEDAEEQVRRIEWGIASLENAYLEETWLRGNVVRGWEVAFRRGGGTSSTTANGGMAANTQPPVPSPSPCSSIAASPAPGHSGSLSNMVMEEGSFQGGLPTPVTPSSANLRKGRSMKPADRIFSLSSVSGSAAVDGLQAAAHSGGVRRDGHGDGSLPTSFQAMALKKKKKSHHKKRLER